MKVKTGDKMEINVPRWTRVLILLLAASAQASQAAEPGKGVEHDPWEGLNRAVFQFNDGLDTYVLKPVSKGYQKVAPEPVQTGVFNFFSNLGEVSNTLNNLLQGEWGRAGNSAGRLALNSTIGLAGLVDVASAAGLRRNESEDFGQTLSVWGLPSGPYLVLPLLGPSTATDTLGLPVDWSMEPVRYMDSDAARLAFVAVESIDERSRLLSAEELISGDRYSFIREAYLQRREYLISNGELEDDFGEDFGDFEDF